MSCDHSATVCLACSHVQPQLGTGCVGNFHYSGRLVYTGRPERPDKSKANLVCLLYITCQARFTLTGVEKDQQPRGKGDKIRVNQSWESPDRANLGGLEPDATDARGQEE